jgi:hypothetical protein
MKIYTRIVIDIATGDMVSAESFNHTGPVAECKGGGSSTTNTTDPVYNAGILKISEDQQAMADKLFNQYMYGVEYNPGETVYGKTIDGKWVGADELKTSQYSSEYFTENAEYNNYKERLDATQLYLGMSEEEAKLHLAQQGYKETEQFTMNENMFEQKTRGELEGYDPNAVTAEAEYYQNLINSNQSLLGSQTEAELANLGLTIDQIGAQRSLIPSQTELAKLQTTDAISAITERAPIRSAYAKAVMEPIDSVRKMNEAQAGVQQTYDLTGKEFERKMFTAGGNPGDPGYAEAINSRNLSMSKDIAAARTKAKQDAEDTQFSRLQGAMSTGF